MMSFHHLPLLLLQLFLNYCLSFGGVVTLMIKLKLNFISSKVGFIFGHGFHDYLTYNALWLAKS